MKYKEILYFMNTVEQQKAWNIKKSYILWTQLNSKKLLNSAQELLLPRPWRWGKIPSHPPVNQADVYNYIPMKYEEILYFINTAEQQKALNIVLQYA